jgi:hypothetical protein
LRDKRGNFLDETSLDRSLATILDPGAQVAFKGEGELNGKRMAVIDVVSPLKLKNGSGSPLRVVARRCFASYPPLPLLFLLAGAQSSDAARTAAGATPEELAASSAGKAAGGELQRLHRERRRRPLLPPVGAP